MNKKEIKEIDKKIRQLHKAAEEVMALGGKIEAVKRNTKRILASVKMLEINICDLNDFVK
jgi:hypothetical protein